MSKTAYTMGACEFCGQAVTLDQEYISKEAANAAATNACNCPAAKRQRELLKEIENAKEKVFQLFGDGASKHGFLPIGSQETISFMLDAVGLVATDCFDSITINRHGCWKATISMNSKGKIKVARSETNVCSLE